MTAKPSRFQAVLYGNEATFAEASPTIDVRLQNVNAVDVAGLQPEMVDASFVSQYATGGYKVIQGPRQGAFSVTLDLTGHGTDPGASTLTATDLYTLLGYCLGGSYSAGDGGIADGNGTATAFDFTGVSGADYSGWLIGALGDGGGNGQAYFSTNSGSTMTVTQALEAVPAASDAIRPMLQNFPLEAPASTVNVTGLAFRLATANIQYDCHGCYCTGISFDGINARQRPTVTLDFAVSWWEVTNGTFPDATATAAKAPAVVMNGQMQLGPGSTRAVYNVRNVSLSIDHTVYPQESASATNQYQVVTGAVFGGSAAMLEVTLDSPASGTTTHRDNFEAETALVGTYTLSGGVPGKAVAFHFPNLQWVEGPQQIETNGLNTEILKLKAIATATTTTDASLAPWHLLMG